MNYFNISYMVAIISLVLAGLTKPGKCQEANPVENVCLGCICEAASSCNLTETCTGDACGLFRINWFYWADSGKLTINGESPDAPRAFENCVFNTECATQTVQNYMKRFKQDCNGDNKIDCHDYATIHNLGGYSCPGRIFGKYARILNQCLLAYTQPDTESSEKPTTEGTKQMTQGDDSVQNFDYAVEVPPLSVFGLVQAKENSTNVSSRGSENLPQLPPPDESVQNFDYAVEIPPLSVFELVRAKENTTTASPRERNKLPQLPPPDNSVQNFDYSVTIPPSSVFELVHAKETTTTASPRLRNKLPQLPPPDSDDSVQNFDYSVTIPPSSVFELVQAKENSTTTSSRESVQLPQLPPPDESVQNFDYAVEIPPLSVFELVREKENTTTNTPLKSGSNNLLGNEKGVSPEFQPRSILSSNDSVFSFPVLFQDTNDTIDGSQLENQSVTSQFLFDALNDYLHRQDRYVEAYLDKNRIENEQNSVLKEIAKNIKPNVSFQDTDVANNIQLRIQKLEEDQDILYKILRQKEITEKYHEHKQQRQEKILVAIQQEHRIDEERNEILRELAKNLNNKN